LGINLLLIQTPQLIEKVIILPWYMVIQQWWRFLCPPIHPPSIQILPILFHLMMAYPSLWILILKILYSWRLM
jgi:hypothetical protein